MWGENGEKVCTLTRYFFLKIKHRLERWVQNNVIMKVFIKNYPVNHVY